MKFEESCTLDKKKGSRNLEMFSCVCKLSSSLERTWNHCDKALEHHMFIIFISSHAHADAELLWLTVILNSQDYFHFSCKANALLSAVGGGHDSQHQLIEASFQVSPHTTRLLVISKNNF